MKVAIVTGIFPPDIGGPATHADDLRAIWGERGHDVTVVTLWDGAETSVAPGLVRFPRRWPWPARLAVVAAWLRANRDAFDAIYATGMHPAAVLGGRLARRPVVVKVVGDPAWERGQRLGLTGREFEQFQRSSGKGARLGAMRWLRDASLRASSAITAPSVYLSDVIESWMGGPAGVTVIPNGVRGGAASARGQHAGQLRVLFVGRLVAVKRVERLISAAARVEGATLEIVGDGPERMALESVARELEVTDRVTFGGELEHREVLTRIGAADVLALASDVEGLPHVVIEALSLGTPVVAPAAGGIPEIVVDEETGLLLPDADVDSLVAAFERLRDAPSERARLSASAAAAGAAWGIDVTADRIEDVIARVAEARPRIVFVGKTTLADPLTPDMRRKVALLLPYANPVFIGIGRPGLRHAGRAREVVFPEGRPRVLASALFYGLAPLVGVGLTAGRRRAAIVCQSPYEGFGVVAVSRALPRSLRPRVVVELHGDWRTATRLYGSGSRGRISPLADRAAEWALRRADRVRVVAEAGEDLAREAGYCGPVDRFVAFVDVEGFLATPPVDPPAWPVALFAGAFERYKAVDVVIDAWAEVVREVPDAQLVMAGDGPMRDEVERRAFELGLASSVAFLGRVSKERVRELLDEASVLLLPSRSEGLPRIVFEAFARARPVVATPVGGVAELVRDGETGRLISVDDAAALAAGTVALFRDPPSARRMGEAGRALARARDPATEFDAGMAALAGWIAGSR
jgi:glycosyltransferase involved in cell wall biosynthesis